MWSRDFRPGFPNPKSTFSRSKSTFPRSRSTFSRSKSTFSRSKKARFRKLKSKSGRQAARIIDAKQRNQDARPHVCTLNCARSEEEKEGKKEEKKGGKKERKKKGGFFFENTVKFSLGNTDIRLKQFSKTLNIVNRTSVENLRTIPVTPQKFMAKTFVGVFHFFDTSARNYTGAFFRLGSSAKSTKSGSQENVKTPLGFRSVFYASIH